MAATLTLVSVSPNSLKYAYVQVTGSGNGEVQKTQAQLVTDAKTAVGASPLAALLEATIVDATWQALPGTASLSLHVNQRPQTSAITNIVAPVGASFDLSSPTNRILLVESADGLNGEATIEIRYHVTPER